MRFVVLLFGLLATVVTAAVGAAFFFDATARTWLHDNNLSVFGFFDLIYNSNDPQRPLTGLFMFIAAGFCLLGTLLGFLRCGWQGGLLMIVSAVGPAVLNPMSLLGLGPQIFAAILSCFVRAVPIVPVPVVEED